MGKRVASADRVDVATVKVKALLAELEEAVQALGERVERDEDQDLDETRSQLESLHGRANDLVAQANAILEAARDLSTRVDARARSAEAFIADFEDDVGSLELRAQALDPDQWEWA
jgi:hypothetical protein